MAASYFYWSSISDLNQNLSILQTNLNSHEEGARKKAEEAFKKVIKTLENKGIRSIDIATLERARILCSDYFKSKDKKGQSSVVGRVTQLFNKEKSIDEKISKTIQQSRERNQLLIAKAISEWRSLPLEQLKEALRSFIMDVCQGEKSLKGKRIPPCSMEDLFAEIKSQLSDKDFQIINLLNDPHLFSSYEWKTGACSTPPPNVADCVASRLDKQTKMEQVSEQSIRETVQKIENERAFRLRNLAMVYSKISEDPSQAVAGKHFEKTSAWYVGSLPEESKTIAFETEMQKIAAAHNMTCITDSNDPELASKDNILIFDDREVAPFPQDFVDFSANEVRIPIMPMKRHSQIDFTFLVYFLEEERKKRNQAWKEPLLHQNYEPAKNPRTGRGVTIGKAWLDKFGLKSVKLALQLGATPVMNLTYNEGGNTLIGSEDGLKFVIIGRDSYAFSKYLMEQELGRVVLEEEVKTAFAIDYGVKRERVFFVEQPGDFHLDMDLAILLGKKTIAVNDAQMAEEAFAADHHQLFRGDEFNPREETEDYEIAEADIKKRIALRAAGKKIFEDITANDLIAQGFTVIRVPWRFDYYAYRSQPRPYMNFFNMVTAIDSEGKKLIVSMGMAEKYRQEFMEKVNCGDVEVPKYYFLDEQESRRCLDLRGGISCRSKTIPMPLYE